MNSNFKFQIKNSEKGITLVEIVVVIFIITMFSVILISDFPQIQRQYALSRAAYKLAQNLRRVQDLGLSGVKIKNDAGESLQAAGYGLYIDLRNPPAKQYLIYADTCRADSRYGMDSSCNNGGQDYIIETINVVDDGPSVFIKAINNVNALFTSINFSPPNPYINIENLSSQKTNIEIVLALSYDPSITRSVSMNTAGLIEVK